ncbi:oxidoreductase [Nonomuraea longicatena]|uniref:Oxidoreductase n=1 Tax=Nonomuraea longicatena TaxID=83682 RepID=A0ABN1NQ41_9ACTN
MTLPMGLRIAALTAACAAVLTAPLPAQAVPAFDATAPVPASGATAPTPALGPAAPAPVLRGGTDDRPLTGLAAGVRLGWEPKATGVSARLRGLSAVDRRVVWASGSAGTVIRTVDGGRTWQNVSPTGTQSLQFRDIEAFGPDSAVVLSIGEGADSRVYRTDDGGRTWAETFRNDEPRAFYDCMAFFDRRNGLAMSDPVDGRFRILSTRDGGRTWRVLPPDGMPEALPGEAGFAASGQCLTTSGGRDAWMASGGAARARVFHSGDRGRTWTVADTPIPGGDPAKGVFGLAFRGPRHGIAVGGDYRTGEASPSAAATTRDGGATWTEADAPPPAYRSGVSLLPHAALAVGPTGSDVSFTGGRSWHTFDTGSFDTVACTADLSCWASGEQGRLARLRLLR